MNFSQAVSCWILTQTTITIKRQMYGRAGYALLRSRVPMAA